MATSTADVWKRRIDKWVEEYAKVEKTHEEARKFYNNKFSPGLITVNLIFSYGRAMVPQLYFKNPSVTVQIKGDLAPRSRLLQEVDVELIKQMQIKRTIKKLIVSSFLSGRGIGKLGFAEEADAGKAFDPAALIKPRQPWFLHVLTKNWAHEMPANGDIDDIPWAAMKVTMTADQIDDRLDGRRAPESLRGALDSLPEDDPDATLDLWEIYDRGAGERGLMYEDSWVEQAKPFSVWPYYLLDFNWVPEETIPVSDAELILQLQKEYNENETQIHEHRRIAVLKLLARKGVFKEAKAQLEDGTVGALLELDTSGPISDAVQEMTPGIPDSLLVVKKALQDDARDVIGFSRNQIGEFQGSGSSRRTFGEAAIVQQALQIRLDERRDMVADLIEHVTRGANQLVFGRWSVEDAKRYAGVLDPAGWADLQRIEKDDYTINVVPDSTLPLSKAIQREQGVQMFAAFKDDPLIDQVKLRRKALEGFEGVDPEDMLNQEAIAMIQGVAGQTGMNPAAILQMIQAVQMQGQGQGPQPKGRNGAMPAEKK